MNFGQFLAMHEEDEDVAVRPVGFLAGEIARGLGKGPFVRSGAVVDTREPRRLHPLGLPIIVVRALHDAGRPVDLDELAILVPNFERKRLSVALTNLEDMGMVKAGSGDYARKYQLTFEGEREAKWT